MEKEKTTVNVKLTEASLQALLACAFRQGFVLSSDEFNGKTVSQKECVEYKMFPGVDEYFKRSVEVRDCEIFEHVMFRVIEESVVKDITNTYFEISMEKQHTERKNN